MASRIEFCAPLGTGKSTIAKALADHYGWMLIKDPVAHHPFLADFYTDPVKHGFESAAFFALSYVHAVKKMENENVIFDYGNILNQCYEAVTPKEDLEKQVFTHLYNLADALPKPDLIVYLEYPSDKVLERIGRRGRDIEKEVSESYIQALQKEIAQRIQDPANTVPVLTLSMEEFDLVKRPEDLQKIAKLVEKKLA